MRKKYDRVFLSDYIEKEREIFQTAVSVDKKTMSEIYGRENTINTSKKFEYELDTDYTSFPFFHNKREIRRLNEAYLSPDKSTATTIRNEFGFHKCAPYAETLQDIYAMSYSPDVFGEKIGEAALPSFIHCTRLPHYRLPHYMKLSGYTSKEIDYLLPYHVMDRRMERYCGTIAMRNVFYNKKRNNYQDFLNFCEYHPLKITKSLIAQETHTYYISIVYRLYILRRLRVNIENRIRAFTASEVDVQKSLFNALKELSKLQDTMIGTSLYMESNEVFSDREIYHCFAMKPGHGLYDCGWHWIMHPGELYSLSTFLPFLPIWNGNVKSHSSANRKRKETKNNSYSSYKTESTPFDGDDFSLALFSILSIGMTQQNNKRAIIAAVVKKIIKEFVITPENFCEINQKLTPASDEQENAVSDDSEQDNDNDIVKMLFCLDSDSSSEDERSFISGSISEDLLLSCGSKTQLAAPSKSSNALDIGKKCKSSKVKEKVQEKQRKAKMKKRIERSRISSHITPNWASKKHVRRPNISKRMHRKKWDKVNARNGISKNVLYSHNAIRMVDVLIRMIGISLMGTYDRSRHVCSFNTRKEVYRFIQYDVPTVEQFCDWIECELPDISENEPAKSTRKRSSNVFRGNFLVYVLREHHVFMVDDVPSVRETLKQTYYWEEIVDIICNTMDVIKSVIDELMNDMYFHHEHCDEHCECRHNIRVKFLRKHYPPELMRMYERWPILFAIDWASRWKRKNAVENPSFFGASQSVTPSYEGMIDELENIPDHPKGHLYYDHFTKILNQKFNPSYTNDSSIGGLYLTGIRDRTHTFFEEKHRKMLCYFWRPPSKNFAQAMLDACSKLDAIFKCENKIFTSYTMEKFKKVPGMIDRIYNKAVEANRDYVKKKRDYVENCQKLNRSIIQKVVERFERRYDANIGFGWMCILFNAHVDSMLMLYSAKKHFNEKNDRMSPIYVLKKIMAKSLVDFFVLWDFYHIFVRHFSITFVNLPYHVLQKQVETLNRKIAFNKEEEIRRVKTRCKRRAIWDEEVDAKRLYEFIKSSRVSQKDKIAYFDIYVCLSHKRVNAPIVEERVTRETDCKTVGHTMITIDPSDNKVYCSAKSDKTGRMKNTNICRNEPNTRVCLAGRMLKMGNQMYFLCPLCLNVCIYSMEKESCGFLWCGVCVEGRRELAHRRGIVWDPITESPTPSMKSVSIAGIPIVGNRGFDYNWNENCIFCRKRSVPTNKVTYYLLWDDRDPYGRCRYAYVSCCDAHRRVFFSETWKTSSLRFCMFLVHNHVRSGVYGNALLDFRSGKLISVSREKKSIFRSDFASTNDAAIAPPTIDELKEFVEQVKKNNLTRKQLFALLRQRPSYARYISIDIPSSTCSSEILSHPTLELSVKGTHVFKIPEDLGISEFTLRNYYIPKCDVPKFIGDQSLISNSVREREIANINDDEVVMRPQNYDSLCSFDDVAAVTSSSVSPSKKTICQSKQPPQKQLFADKSLETACSQENQTKIDVLRKKIHLLRKRLQNMKTAFVDKSN